MKVKVIDLKPGMFLIHSARGIVKFTDACAEMMKTHGDTTSCFVEDGGELIEVSIGCLTGKD